MTPFAQLGEMEKSAQSNAARKRLLQLLPKMGEAEAVKAKDFIRAPWGDQFAPKNKNKNLGPFPVEFRTERAAAKLKSLEVERPGLGRVQLEDLKSEPGKIVWRGSHNLGQARTANTFATGDPRVARDGGQDYGKYITRTRSKDWEGGLPKFDQDGKQIIPDDPGRPFYSPHHSKIDRETRLKLMADAEAGGPVSSYGGKLDASPVYEIIGNPIARARPPAGGWKDKTGPNGGIIAVRIKNPTLYERIAGNTGANDTYRRGLDQFEAGQGAAPPTVRDNVEDYAAMRRSLSKPPRVTPSPANLPVAPPPAKPSLLGRIKSIFTTKS